MVSFEERLKASTDAFNRQDIDGYLALYADDAVLYDPLSPEPSRGKEAIRSAVEALWEMFPDAHIETLRLVVAGVTAAGEIANSGTNRGSLKSPTGTLPATNRHGEFRAAFFARLNSEGRVIEGRRYWDTTGFMKQLGIGPPR